MHMLTLLHVFLCLLLVSEISAVLNPEPFQEGLHDFTQDHAASQRWISAMLESRDQAAARIPFDLSVRIHLTRSM